jgi:hypothetical protein
MKKITAIFMSLSFGWAFAQLNDSIFIPNNQFYQHQLDQLWENPLLYSNQNLKDFTQVELSYLQKQLNLKRVQTAREINQYNFKTEGIYNINPNLRLFGKFNYNFERELGLGYNLSSDRTENQITLRPNYLYAPKEAEWENQTYNIKGGTEYEFKNILFGVVVDYTNKNNFRKSDPRPEIATADYSGKAFLGYHFGSHILSIFGGLGRKTQTYDLISVNEYVNTTTNPEYYLRYVNGYGRVISFNSYPDYIHKNIDKTFGGAYAFQSKNHFVNVSYSYDKSMEDVFTRSADGTVYLDKSLIRFKYREISHFADLNYYYQGDENKWLAYFSYKTTQGDNYNVPEAGQNYRMTNDQFHLKTQFLNLDKDRTNYVIGADALYQKQSNIDLLGVIHKNVECVDFKIFANKDFFYESPSQRLNVEIAGLGYMPLSNDLSYQAVSSSAFYDAVISKDYVYDQTKKLGMSFGLQYYMPFKKRNSIKFFANFTNMFAVSKEYENMTGKSQNNNLYFNSGISLFY